MHCLYGEGNWPERAMKRTAEQRLEHIIRRMQADTAVDAPAELTSFAKGLYRTRVAEPTPSIFKRMAAVLSVDLAPGRAAFGERSATGGQARQMLFEAGENAVDLRVTALDKAFDIRGQILGDGFESGSVEIAGQSVEIDNGGFTVKGVAAGEHSLTVRGGEQEIFIEKIILS